VSWQDAVAYCKKLTERERKAGELPDGWVYRLPSEAEWEYAARAGSSGARYGKLEKIAWYDENGEEKPHPVGEKRANAWGLKDVLGNVWEWTLDPWHSNYERAPVDGSVWEKGGDGFRRAVRGGSWYGDAWFVRAASRYGLVPVHRYDFLGFRCCLVQE
jgi:formylglycine-generating enzyme required for sulfatase activity